MTLIERIDPKQKIKNIIFDLGGVIININYHLTIQKFKNLGIENIENAYSQLRQENLFDQFEIGAITPAEFREGIRRMSSADISDEVIDKTWGAMLLDIPEERISLLQEAKKRYNTFLLSNTNEIHLGQFSGYIKQKFEIDGLGPLFIKDYYSHEIGLRKPNADIFEFVLAKNKLKPEETFFIDDSPQHIEAAVKLGIQAYHLTSPETILNLFSNGTN
jgi:FMN phosphatase YigB (HAD superfamily)